MPLVAVLRCVAPFCGIAVAVIGAAVLIGWAFDVARLKNLLPHLPTMKANAALALLLGGASLCLLARPAARARRAARAGAVALALIGGLT
ncbi:MAG: hypothetical protein ACREK4_23290, partial [Candidatus Rokuibacteriota bacterium]